MNDQNFLAHLKQLKTQAALLRSQGCAPKEMAGIIEEVVKNLESYSREYSQPAEQTKSSEEKYKALCDNVPGMVYKGRPDWSVEIIANSERICGYSIEDFQAGKFGWLDVIHPDDREAVVAEADAFSKTPGDLIQQYRIISKDGSIRWLEDHKKTVFQDGVYQGVEGVVFDISERKKAEGTLRKSDEKYRQLVSTITDAIVLFDAETRQFIDVNRAAEDLYGYSRDEFLSMRQPDLTAEYQESEESIARTRKGELARIPLRYHRKKDGTVFPVEISGSTFELEGRKVLCGVLRDITDRKKAEETWRASEEKFRLAMEAANDALWDWNIVTNQVYRNPRHAIMLGYEPDEIPPDQSEWEKRVHPDDRETVFGIRLLQNERRS